MIETAFNNTAAAQAAHFRVQIRVDQIHAGYGKKEVLRGISLTAAKGEMVAVIGPNGSGKSTLLKVISGFFGTQQVEMCGLKTNGLRRCSRMTE